MRLVGCSETRHPTRLLCEYPPNPYQRPSSSFFITFLASKQGPHGRRPDDRGRATSQPASRSTRELCQSWPARLRLAAPAATLMQAAQASVQPGMPT